jgi:hypothetical protein
MATPPALSLDASSPPDVTLPFLSRVGLPPRYIFSRAIVAALRRKVSPLASTREPLRALSELPTSPPGFLFGMVGGHSYGGGRRPGYRPAENRRPGRLAANSVQVRSGTARDSDDLLAAQRDAKTRAALNKQMQRKA